jgi:very-short-patch-repair endonuclease
MRTTAAPNPAECRPCSLSGNKVDSRPDLWVARRAADQWGVLSLDELGECGLSRKAVMVRVRNGQLHPLHRGVYAVGHPNVPLEGRFVAAIKACGPQAVLSHFSAAALYGLVKWDDRYPEVTVPGTATRTHRGIRVHRSSMLDVRDTTRHRGIPTTTPARTLIDLAASFNYKALRRTVRQAQNRLTNVPQILNALDRLGPRRGTAKLTKILATGPAPTRSELEDTVLDLILHGGFKHPDVNRPLRIDGRRVIPDFRWPTQRLVIEADGAEWHDNPIAREDDAERQAILEAHGERVLRVTWQQAITRRPETLRRIRSAGAPTYTLEAR